LTVRQRRSIRAGPHVVARRATARRDPRSSAVRQVGGAAVDLGRYLLGVLLAGAALLPVYAACRSWVRLLLPVWTATLARLAEIVLVLATVTLVAEVLGTVGLLKTGPTTASLSIVGAVGWWAARRRDAVSLASREIPPAEQPRPIGRLPVGALLVAVVVTSVVVADWSGPTIAALHHGVSGVDTLWYHMPFAARFAQTGSITALHYVDAEPVTVFYPAGSELLHALGIVFFGSDFLSPLLNMGWLALALLAGWVVGRPFGVAPVTLTGVAVLLATPGMVATQAGSAYTDVVGLALLASSVALMVNSARPGSSFVTPGLAVSALAAGLALGTKFTLIAPVAALTAGIILIAPRRSRLRQGGTWTALVLLTGSFWYLRNLIRAGSPLPSLHLSLGPLSLPSPHVSTPTADVGQYLLNGSVWHRYFLPGLRLSLGPLWWAILVCAAAGSLLIALSRSSRDRRMLGVVAIVSAIAFVYSPQFLGFPDAPIYFVYNLRYSAPALLIGLLLLPLSPAVLRRGLRWWVLGVLAATLLLTQLDPTIWPTSLLTQRFAVPASGVDSLLGGLVGITVLALGSTAVLLRRSPSPWRLTPAKTLRLTQASVLGCVALVVVGYFLQRLDLAHRYVNAEPMPAIYDWARGKSQVRIAIDGPLVQLQYPLYGDDLSNYVQYVGRQGTHGAFTSIKDCASWRRAINQSHYSHILVASDLEPTRAEAFAHPSPVYSWTATDPATTVIMRETSSHISPPTPGYVVFSVFRVHGRLDPDRCSELPLAARTR
jgi:hypothetical protein